MDIIVCIKQVPDVTEVSWDPETGSCVHDYAYPDVTCPDDLSVYENELPRTLSGALPSGGDYSGPGVAGHVFDPAVAGVGVHEIMYTYTDQNGCMNSCSFTITVKTACVEIEAYVYLEGAVVVPDGSDTYALPMRTDLNAKRLLPGQRYKDPFLGILYSPPGQPYNVAPWFYAGPKDALYDSSVDPLNGDASYGATVVDWVLVSLRASADGEGGPVCQAVALLHNDGSLVFVDGPLACCDLDMYGEYYLVIEHCSHLLVMSPEPLPILNDKIVYDFRIQQSYINDPFQFGYSGQKEIFPGVFAMFGGNGQQANAPDDDVDINFDDGTFWQDENGKFNLYLFGDYNLNGDGTEAC